MEIEEVPDLILEFVGEPKLKKKDAAESAAEGAFWYLQQEGYVHIADDNCHAAKQ